MTREEIGPGADVGARVEPEGGLTAGTGVWVAVDPHAKAENTKASAAIIAIQVQRRLGMRLSGCADLPIKLPPHGG